jgi:hypothetical protein
MVMSGLLLLLAGAGTMLGGVGIMGKYKEGLGGIIAGYIVAMLGMVLVICGLVVTIFVN